MGAEDLSRVTESQELWTSWLLQVPCSFHVGLSSEDPLCLQRRVRKVPKCKYSGGPGGTDLSTGLPKEHKVMWMVV